MDCLILTNCNKKSQHFTSDLTHLIKLLNHIQSSQLLLFLKKEKDVDHKQKNYITFLVNIGA